MQFDSFSDAIAMGGHGPYVWGAYAITLVVVMVILLRPIVLLGSCKARSDERLRDNPRNQ